MKKLKATLSANSIQELKREIQDYKKRLNDRNLEFLNRLKDVGIPVIDRRMSAAKGDSSPAHTTVFEVESIGDGVMRATLAVNGEDLLFIEFGAGVHFNGAAGSSPHPKGAEYGYTIGSYGKGLGKNDHWYYRDEGGNTVKSYGTQSTMPVYMAAMEMFEKAQRMAREVFRT